MRKQSQRLKKAILPFGLAAVLALCQSPYGFPSYGYGADARGPGPGEEEEEAEYDEAALARLADNVLEYDEIADLIHKYNTDIQQKWDEFNKNKTESARIQTELISQARLMRDLKEKAEEEGEEEDTMYYAQQEGAYKSMAERYSDIMDSYDKPRSVKSLRWAERELTRAAQTLMFSYNSLRLQRENQEKLKEVYDMQYQLAQAEAQVGTKTAFDVQAAANKVLGAESALLAIDNSIAEIKSSLCVMTGWPADGNPEIGQIPEADMSRVDSWNLSEDTIKAIGNNQTLISQRTEGYAKSSSGIENHLRVVDQGEQQLTIKMESLYQGAMEKRNTYLSAQTGFQSASIARNTAEQKHRMGMLSKSEYLEAELTYLQKKAARDSANIELYEAIEAYEWAVQGFTEIE
ncbi:TolC family protein [Lachnospiraceae bacterium 62-35]